LVFGQQLKSVQIESLHYIPAGSCILIVGGGTGWILEEIANLFPSGLEITYIDKSSKMIELSKKRNYQLNTVEFINAPLEDTSLKHDYYNVILTPFFLDCFSQPTFEVVSEKLDKSLNPLGLWLYIDFYLSAQSTFMQKILVKFMYTFFRLASRIEARKLPDIDSYFSTYNVLAKKMYYHNFIQLQVLQKSK